MGGGGVCEEEISSPLSSVGQEELAVLRRQLEGKDGEVRRLQDETGFKAVASSSADPTERGGKAGQQSQASLRITMCDVKVLIHSCLL